MGRRTRGAEPSRDRRERPARPSLRAPLGRPVLSRAFGGSRFWTVVVIGATTLRVLRRMRSKDGEPLYRTVIRPGDRFEVVARAPR